MSEPSLEVQDLTFSYPDGHHALHEVGLHVHHGERVALLGPNGAGKTTLLLHLNGILRPAKGIVRVAGLEVSDDSAPEVRRRVGLVFQDPDDQLFMPTVGQDVAFGPANSGLGGTALDTRVRDALEAVSMFDALERAPHHLSYGERRRVAIATVLAMRPEILVLDEPTSNLDPASRRELIVVLQGLAITQLVVTHDLPFALELCPRALVMDEGRIVAGGPTMEILMDERMMKAHRLELPYRFDPRASTH
ncbi:MAG TPA: ABC transporter ATP-binding protein [Acidimicrobiia bacterium]